jgi:hypothetical protein
MPKKIIEREIIDEDSELSGSEHSVKNTEPTPPEPKSKTKQKLNPEAIKEINKKLRTINATNTRVKQAKEKQIQIEVEERLKQERKKQEDNQKMRKNFENDVESIVMRMINNKISTDEPIEEKPVPKQKVKPQPKQRVKPRAPIEEQPEENENMNAMRMYRNLFM